MALEIKYQQYCETSLFGRYINADHIINLLKKHSAYFEISVIGKSVLNEDIHFVKIGTGEKKILMWSQMHGNESTTTKAVFDLMNIMTDSEHPLVGKLLETCTIGIIPMLSPDGSRSYTRLNANQVDLNRDAQRLSQPESRVLRACFDNFQPSFCFNLHGQRTIFSAGAFNKPATVSFLSPAQDNACTVTETRKKAMDIIVRMNESLQNQIPNQVGIYDDAFNIHCVGDTFQTLEVPTILFEAGHCHEDYHREKVRALILDSLWVGLKEIAFNEIQGVGEEAYFKIPQNEKLFYDIIVRNAKLRKGESYQILDIAVQFEERLDRDHIIFIPKIEKIADLSGFFGHKEIEAHGELVFTENYKELNEGVEIDFVLINNKKHQLYEEIK
ncbi:M14 family zinc carboxypeptidase [Gelidibacter mesophilus]|uniref:M14 family zinc carboxypeptidase n=1 Tax=Gelidibacter mesophilus TaxID=169050 RepID=UPI00041B7FCC|nr:M14 family zinc carboxypeptidase [Gelidibacter mesophilus]